MKSKIIYIELTVAGVTEVSSLSPPSIISTIERAAAGGGRGKCRLCKRQIIHHNNVLKSILHAEIVHLISLQLKCTDDKFPWLDATGLNSVFGCMATEEFGIQAKSN